MKKILENWLFYNDYKVLAFPYQLRTEKAIVIDAILKEKKYPRETYINTSPIISYKNNKIITENS